MELYSGLTLAADLEADLVAVSVFAASCELTVVLREPLSPIAGCWVEVPLLATPFEPLPEIYESLLDVPVILFHFEEELLCLSLLPYATELFPSRR